MTREFTLTETGVQDGERILVGIHRVEGGIRIVSPGADLPDEAAKHVETLIREARTNDTIELKAVMTDREIEVLRHLAGGHSNKQVARSLGLSIRTVETHRLNLRKKTQTGRLSDLMLLAKRLGITPVGGA